MKRILPILFSIILLTSCETSKSSEIREDVKDSKEETKELIEESADEIEEEDVEIEEGPID